MVNHIGVDEIAEKLEVEEQLVRKWLYDEDLDEFLSRHDVADTIDSFKNASGHFETEYREHLKGIVQKMRWTDPIYSTEEIMECTGLTETWINKQTKPVETASDADLDGSKLACGSELMPESRFQRVAKYVARRMQDAREVKDEKEIAKKLGVEEELVRGWLEDEQDAVEPDNFLFEFSWSEEIMTPKVEYQELFSKIVVRMLAKKPKYSVAQTVEYTGLDVKFVKNIIKESKIKRRVPSSAAIVSTD